jgi:glycosyltransferase involved in cell wall biosynthesis
MSKTILALGYIPKGKGGKQTTGLATGIFDLHDAVNQLNSEFKVVIAATDVHQKKIKIDNTDVIGWDKKSLIRHSLRYPFRTFYFIFKTVALLRFRKLLAPLNTLARLIFLDYAIEITKPDLIHFHGSSGALLSTGLWDKNSKKILRIHGINGFNQSIPNYKIHRKIEKYITGLTFEKVTFVANGVLQEWEKYYNHFTCNMIPILNGYNSKLFYPSKTSYLSNEKYDLITISGISENKGQKRVIEALLKLREAGYNISYLIIGSGPQVYLESLKKLVEVHNLAVTFIDYLPQEKLIAYLHQSKYFILPSITEGFGKVYIESIGAGVPVIIPEHLPLSKENNLLNNKNSAFIKDSTVESIESRLKDIFLTNIQVSNDEISYSVKDLKWTNLAKKYLKIYASCL